MTYTYENTTRYPESCFSNIRISDDASLVLETLFHQSSSVTTYNSKQDKNHHPRPTRFFQCIRCWEKSNSSHYINRCNKVQSYRIKKSQGVTSISPWKLSVLHSIWCIYISWSYHWKWFELSCSRSLQWLTLQQMSLCETKQIVQLRLCRILRSSQGGKEL